jgi:cob(I)alamin adenosyltransferase
MGVNIIVDKPNTKKGLLIVHTGGGKGKTTAALGLALRAAGHGMKVCFIQFIKGSWKAGELEALKQFENLIDLHVMGKGFTWKSDDIEKDKAAALAGWEFAQEALASRRYAMVVLDEFTYLLSYGMIDIEPVLATMSNRPANLHVVITGRGAPLDLLDAADLVTEMRVIKHPLKKGVKAQKGIEF